jgi:hypothetical protein
MTLSNRPRNFASLPRSASSAPRRSMAMPGDLRHARHQFVIARRRHSGLAPVDGEGADDLPVGGDDGRGPGGAQPACRAASRRYSHSASVSMSATVTWRAR